jgi:hypothetical protein
MKTFLIWLGVGTLLVALGAYPALAQLTTGSKPFDGTLATTLNSTVASGSDAIKLTSGAHLNFGTVEMYQNGSALDITGSNEFSTTTGTLTLRGYVDAQKEISNSSANNGGSVAFNDPIRNLSTTSFTLESSTTFTGGNKDGFTLKLLNSPDDRTLDNALFITDDAFTSIFRINGSGMPQINPVNTSGAPTCSATYRFMTWVVAGAAGVADTYQVCTKDESDVYAWRSVY